MTRMAYTYYFGMEETEEQKQEVTSSWQQMFAVLCLLTVILVSAFAVVYIKDLNRRLFIQYQELEQVQQQAQIDRGKLLLERTTLAAQSRIQMLAHQRLNMVIPSRTHIVIVRE